MTSQNPPTTQLPPSSDVPPAGPPTDPPYGSSAGGWSPAPSNPGRAPLRRSREDRVIGGVCGGLAAHTGIDALLFRVGAIALTFAGGSGILIYLLLWVLMPSKPGDQGPRTRRKLRIGLLVVGVLALLGVITAAVGALVFGLGDWHDGGSRDREFSPRSVQSVEGRYSSSIGDIDLDLSGVDVSDLSSPIRTEVVSNAGDIDIQVPASADVEVRVENRMGEVELFGQGGDGGPFAGGASADGGLFEGSGSGSWTGDGDPEIVLVVDSGIGDVDVDRG